MAPPQGGPPAGRAFTPAQPTTARVNSEILTCRNLRDTCPPFSAVPSSRRLATDETLPSRPPGSDGTGRAEGRKDCRGSMLPVLSSNLPYFRPSCALAWERADRAGASGEDVRVTRTSRRESG